VVLAEARVSACITASGVVCSKGSATIPVVARFSLGGGDPDAPDAGKGTEKMTPAEWDKVSGFTTKQRLD
jgi:hypothetical protein